MLAEKISPWQSLDMGQSTIKILSETENAIRESLYTSAQLAIIKAIEEEISCLKPIKSKKSPQEKI